MVKIHASHCNILKTERVAKIIALVLGISFGCLYSSCFHNFFSENFTSDRTKLLSETWARIKLPPQQVQVLNETALFLMNDDTSLADELSRNITILCWLNVKSIDTNQFDAIKNTWGQRCTKFIAIASSTDTKIDSSDIFQVSGAADKSSYLAQVYSFIAENYIDQFDWFINTDGRSFVVMENLRYHLYAHNPSDSLVFGLLKNSTSVKQQQQQYLSMSAAFVLSRQAVTDLNAGFLSQTEKNCALAAKRSDDEIHFSRCLREVGITFGKSTDHHDKILFFDQHLDKFLLPDNVVKLPHPWYAEYKVNHYLNSASNYSIAFYGLSWKEMHVMEFSIYQLRPYHIEIEAPPLPKQIRLT